MDGMHDAADETVGHLRKRLNVMREIVQVKTVYPAIYLIICEIYLSVFISSLSLSLYIYIIPGKKFKNYGNLKKITRPFR